MLDTEDMLDLIQIQSELDVYEWNVIDEKDFKKRIRSVFEQVSNALINTLGPSGKTTIIEKFGEMHITKDGWQVLKKIHFKDNINNTICGLLYNICAQVVIKVGDGTTSSIVAASEILSNLERNKVLEKIRSKDLEMLINRCVNNITEIIAERATIINKNTDATYDEIYQLSLISTNGDAEVANIIRNIYYETGNPSIEYVQSKNNKTYMEIVDGFKSNITYLDPIYTNTDSGICEINNPIILCFDHKIEKYHYEKIIQPAIQKAFQEETKLVVIAPHYDNFLLSIIKQTATSEYKATGKLTVVYCRVSLFNNMANTVYGDFCMLTGASMIDEVIVNEIGENGLSIDAYIGTVEKLSIGDKTTLSKGFSNKNSHSYNLFLNDAIAKFKKLEEQHKEMNIVNSELYEVKQRIAKLKCKMGIIYVGGNSSLAKVSNMDLVEDAVKASESAYNYGYNIGGNLIIPIVAEELANQDDVNPYEKEVYKLLSESFKEVFFNVLDNKYNGPLDKEEDTMVIVENCVKNKICYDLNKDEYSDEIINSCHTDIEILKAATSIVEKLVNSNQYVHIDHEPTRQ